MKYRIKCTVSGGITGFRQSYLKSGGGNICEYPDISTAQREAYRLTREMNHGARSATFNYSVEAAS